MSLDTGRIIHLWLTRRSEERRVSHKLCLWLTRRSDLWLTRRSEERREP